MKSNRTIITFNELCEICALSDPSEVITWLRAKEFAHIGRVFPDKKKIIFETARRPQILIH